MRPYLRTLWMTPLAMLLIAATPPADPEELIRLGNAAFEGEDYEAALKFYVQAEERTTNPGMVACNKGAALYKTGDFRGAEAHYRRCLEDATGPRRAAFLYDLGNALLMQSKGADPKLLRQAVDCYLLCLRENEAPEQLRGDAQHNLEIAKVLYAKAKQTRPGKDPGKDNPDDPKDNKPPDPKPPEDNKTPGSDPTPGQKGEPMPMGKQEPVDPRDPRQPVQVETPPPPGPGNLPPIPDSDDGKKMLPEDAAKHVVRAAERILLERREHHKRMAPAPSRVISDW